MSSNPPHKFDWENYITLSESLVNSGDESYWRCSISRAYYGAFCIARNKLGFKKQRKFWDKKGNRISVHTAVVNAYTDSNDPQKVKIGMLLFELKKFRGKSDYREHVKITENVAEDKVKKARECINKIFTCYGNKIY